MMKHPHLNREVVDMLATLKGVPCQQSYAIAREAKDVGTLVELLLMRHKVGQIRPENVILENWDFVAGPRMAPYCRPLRLQRDGTLMIAVEDSVLKRELLFRQREILQRIRSLAGCEMVKGIVTSAG